jgi:hypothetical protein
VRALAAFALLLIAGTLHAQAEPACAELNRLYQEKYIDDFSLSRGFYEFGESDAFECDGFDKNYIMARAFHDFDALRPVNDRDEDYYASVSEVLNLVDDQLRYVPSLTRFPLAEARTFHEGALSAIFYTDKMIRSKERFRPTYTLVHEARHTLKHKLGISDEPGHIVCTRGKHIGKRVCDEVLAKEADLVRGSGNSHEFLFLIYVRNHPNASETIRREAKEQLSYLVANMFNRLEPGILEYYGVRP